jgi:hypothetical protein
MAVTKRRSKMVSFRLSEQEYHDLLRLCEQRGSRSISDLARDAVSSLLAPSTGQNGDGIENGNAAEGGGIEHRIHALYGRMEELDREVKRLADLLAVRIQA